MIKSDSVTGLCMLVFGLVLWLVLIPRGTETFGSDWVEPDTLPNLLAWSLIALGAVLALRPTDHQMKSKGALSKFAMFFCILVAGVWAISVFGFLFVSPVLVAVLMFATGERRARWLAAGVLGIPAGIWAAIGWLLDRPLPGGPFG